MDASVTSKTDKRIGSHAYDYVCYLDLQSDVSGQRYGVKCLRGVSSAAYAAAAVYGPVMLLFVHDFSWLSPVSSPICRQPAALQPAAIPALQHDLHHFTARVVHAQSGRHRASRAFRQVLINAPPLHEWYQSAYTALECMGAASAAACCPFCAARACCYRPHLVCRYCTQPCCLVCYTPSMSAPWGGRQYACTTLPATGPA
jgi:hypothetical protein